MGKGWARSFSKICRQKGLSTPDEILAFNIKHMKKIYDQSIPQLMNRVINKIKNIIANNESLDIRKFGKLSKDGKKRNWKGWFAQWSGLSGGSRLEDGFRNLLGTYIPEAIYDSKVCMLRKRLPTDPEPQRCALLVKLMTEMVPEFKRNDIKEMPIKVEGNTNKTKVKTEDIPVTPVIEASVGHCGKEEVIAIKSEVKPEDILDVRKVEGSYSFNKRGQFGYDSSKKAGDEDYNSNRQRGGTGNLFRGGQHVYRGSRAGYEGYNFNRRRGRTDNRFGGGQYGYRGSRYGYGGFNADRFHPY